MKTYVSALILVSTIGLPQGAHAQRAEVPVPPPVPEAIEVSAEYTPYLAAHAIGTQGYMCVVAGTVFKWTFFGPQATLFDGDNRQIMAHYLSPTPYSLLPNPTWQHSRDSSTVWGQVMRSSSDPGYVAPGAIPWLLLEAAMATS